MAAWALLAAAPCVSAQIRSPEAPARQDAWPGQLGPESAWPGASAPAGDERVGREQWEAAAASRPPGAHFTGARAGDAPGGPRWSFPSIDPRRRALLLSFLAGCLGSFLMTAALLPSLLRRHGAAYVREYRRRVEGGSRVIVVQRPAGGIRPAAGARYASRGRAWSHGETFAEPHFHSAQYNSPPTRVVEQDQPEYAGDDGGVLRRVVEQNIALRR